MKSTICTTETGLVLGATSLEGEVGTFAQAGASLAAGGAPSPAVITAPDVPA